MNADSSIITAQEVIDNTPKGQGQDVQLTKPFVILKEEGLFRVWLGLDFYAALIDDLSDNSTFTHFVENTVYNSIGQKVLWRDTLFTLIQATDGSQLPSDEAYWSESTKFDTPAYEFLYKRYLRTVISWHIMQSTLVYHAIRQNGLNLGKTSSQSSQAVDDITVASFKSEVGIDLNDFLLTMDQYLRDNKATFPLYLGNKLGYDTNGNTQIGYPRNHFGFSFG